ncbi:hypothetical protein DFH09DRAFT_1119545 [Mycena vulgaris]|nr:hypothetical protein DFH09DRAFT_1119545 [Mycena vulgaris]
MNPIILLACAFLAIAAPVLPGREAERGLDSPAIDAHVNAPSVDSENIGWTVDGNNDGPWMEIITTGPSRRSRLLRMRWGRRWAGNGMMIQCSP